MVGGVLQHEPPADVQMPHMTVSPRHVPSHRSFVLRVWSVHVDCLTMAFAARPSSGRLSGSGTSPKASPRTVPRTSPRTPRGGAGVLKALSGKARPKEGAGPCLDDALPFAARCLSLSEAGVWIGNANGLFFMHADEDQPRAVYPRRPVQSARHALCLLQVGDTLWAGFSDAMIRVFNCTTFDLVRELQAHVGDVCSLSGHRQMVASGGADGCIRLWDVDAFTCVRTLSGHTGRVQTVLTDGAAVYSGSGDCTVLVWSAVTGQQLKCLAGHEATVRALLRTPRFLWSGAADCTVKIWDLETGSCLNTLEGHVEPVMKMALLGDQVWTAGQDGIKVWKEDGTPVGKSSGRAPGPPVDMQCVPCSQKFKVWVAREDGIEIWSGGCESHGADHRLQVVGAAGIKTLMRLQNQLETSSKEFHECVSEKVSAQKEVERLTREDQESQWKIRSLKTKLEHCQSLLDASEESNKNLRRDQLVLSGKLSSVQEQNVELESRVKELADKNVLLTQQLSALAMRAENTEHEKDSASKSKSGGSKLPGSGKEASQEPTHRELGLKFQGLLAVKQELETSLSEQKRELTVKSDEVRELSLLIAHRDTALTSLKGIIHKQEQEKQSFIERLEVYKAAHRQIGDREAAVKATEQQLQTERERMQWLEDKVVALKDQVVELKEFKSSVAPVAPGHRDFVFKSRNLLIRAVHQLWDTIGMTDKVAISATDLIRSMIFSIHTRDELENNLDEIQEQYSALFQLLDLVRVAHHQARNLLTLYLTDVERLTLGLPAKGFELNLTELDLEDVEDEIQTTHGQLWGDGSRASYVYGGHNQEYNHANSADTGSLDEASSENQSLGPKALNAEQPPSPPQRQKALGDAVLEAQPAASLQQPEADTENDAKGDDLEMWI